MFDCVWKKGVPESMVYLSKGKAEIFVMAEKFLVLFPNGAFADIFDFFTCAATTINKINLYRNFALHSADMPGQKDELLYVSTNVPIKLR